jgi:hypothetical protein
MKTTRPVYFVLSAPSQIEAAVTTIDPYATNEDVDEAESSLSDPPKTKANSKTKNKTETKTKTKKKKKTSKATSKKTTPEASVTAVEAVTSKFKVNTKTRTNKKTSNNSIKKTETKAVFKAVDPEATDEDATDEDAVFRRRFPLRAFTKLLKQEAKPSLVM